MPAPLLLAGGIAAGLGAAGEFAGRLMGAEARRDEFNQRIRALEMKKAYTLSLTTARAAASGVDLSSLSIEKYLKDLSTEFDLELAGLKRSKSTTYTADLLGAGAGLLGNAGRFMLGAGSLWPASGGDEGGGSGPGLNWGGMGLNE